MKTKKKIFWLKLSLICIACFILVSAFWFFGGGIKGLDNPIFWGAYLLLALGAYFWIFV